MRHRPSIYLETPPPIAVSSSQWLALCHEDLVEGVVVVVTGGDGHLGSDRSLAEITDPLSLPRQGDRRPAGSAPRGSQVLRRRGSCRGMKKKARGGEMVPSQQSDHIEARLSSWIGGC